MQFYLKKRRVIKDFIGHCCELDKQSIVESPDAHLPRKFDGYLFLPDYQLLISPNFENVDIHAFGEDSVHDLSPVMHGVVNEITAIEAAKKGIIPTGNAARIANYQTEEIWLNDQLFKASSFCFILLFFQ